MYQYLSWFRQGSEFPSGNKLCSEHTITQLKKSLLSTKAVEVHESVQRYNGLGSLQFTPIYADFDGPKSDQDVIKLYRTIESEFMLAPEIFFSGNRGYHLFVNVPVTHSHPHLVVKRLMTILCPEKSFDAQLYTTRHLLRSEGSINFKSGLYKVKVLIDDVGTPLVKTSAKTPKVSPRVSHQSRVLDLFLNTLYASVNQELRDAETKYRSIKKDDITEIAPCIKAIISEGPIAGQNNERLSLIARNLNSSGISLEEALAIMADAKWVSHQREISSVFKSTYKLQSFFGCKNNQTLKSYCDPFCRFNSDPLEITKEMRDGK